MSNDAWTGRLRSRLIQPYNPPMSAPAPGNIGNSRTFEIVSEFSATLNAVAVLLMLTLLATLPGVWSVVRPRPAALMATGRNG